MEVKRILLQVDHSTFGGKLYDYDFDTNYQFSKNLAERIASDWKFDKDCKRLGEMRDKKNAEILGAR